MPLEDGDPRLEYVVSHATVSLGLERAKFLKSFLNEDNLNRLEAFSDEDTVMAGGEATWLERCPGTRHPGVRTLSVSVLRQP